MKLIAISWVGVEGGPFRTYTRYLYAYLPSYIPVYIPFSKELPILRCGDRFSQIIISKLFGRYLCNLQHLIKAIYSRRRFRPVSKPCEGHVHCAGLLLQAQPRLRCRVSSRRILWSSVSQPSETSLLPLEVQGEQQADLVVLCEPALGDQPLMR